MSYNNTYNFEKTFGIDMSSAKDLGAGEFKSYCPFCHDGRKREHLQQKEFWFNTRNGCYRCHNCGRSGRIDSEEYKEWLSSSDKGSPSSKAQPKGNVSKPVETNKGQRIILSQRSKQEEKDYKEPKDWKNFHVGSLKVESGPVRDYLLNERCIGERVIGDKLVGSDTQWNPEAHLFEPVVVFNYYLGDKLVDQKYRFISKKGFFHTPDCRHVPYNINSLLSKADGKSCSKGSVYIVEGEMDVLSMKSAGFERTISVSDGANGNLEWVGDFWEQCFKDVEGDFVIAVDTDVAGTGLADRLIARFGPENCRRVTFGSDCKDSNEYLVKYGAEGLRERVDSAPYCRVEDVFDSTDVRAEVEELFEKGAFPGHRVGWASHFDEETKTYTPKGLDDIVRWDTKRLVLVTGRSGDGKSEFVDELVLRLNLSTGWKVAYFTPEKYPTKYHQESLSEKMIGKSFKSSEMRRDREYMSRDELESFLDWAAKNVFYIGVKFDNMFIDRILKAADVHVKRHGIKILVIDPYNYIEKEMEREWQLNQWDSKTISKIRNFALNRDLLIFLVAHPRKVYENNKDGERRRIEMTDISGTADFSNKADVCIVVDRHRSNDVTTIYVDKVRNKDNGGKGVCSMLFIDDNGRFASCVPVKIGDKGSDEYQTMYNTAIRDESNWLEKKPTIWVPDGTGKIVPKESVEAPEIEEEQEIVEEQVIEEEQEIEEEQVIEEDLSNDPFGPAEGEAPF